MLHIVKGKKKSRQYMNYLWAVMMLTGVVYAALTGNLEAVTEQAVSSAKEAVSLCITMTGVMAFWVGMMQIADGAGMIRRAAGRLNPVLSFLFPDLPKEHPARKPIATNIVANILGLGWAATPAGLEAMKALSGEERERTLVERLADSGQRNASCDRKTSVSERTATDAMCDFLILNISSLQLIPVNIIAYRSQYGSVNPSRIVGPAIFATLISTLAAVIFIKLRRAFGRKL
jgi:spore maturation protein A